MQDESNILQNCSVITKFNVDRRRISNSNAVLWNILFRVLTFIFSIQATVYWYHLFFDKYFITEVMGYTLIFICGAVLLSDLIIDDKETE